jgi:hypothetical protein
MRESGSATGTHRGPKVVVENRDELAQELNFSLSGNGSVPVPRHPVISLRANAAILDFIGTHL